MRHAVQEIYSKIYEHLKPMRDKGKEALYHMNCSSTGDVYNVELTCLGENVFLTMQHLNNGRLVDVYRLYKNGSLVIKDDDMGEGDSEIYLTARADDSYEIITAIYQKLFQKNPSVISFKEIDRMVGSMNPFNHDLFRMGQAVNDEWTVMFSSMDKNELVLVNTVNGRRFVVDVGLARIN